jgi:predicted Zn-dependent protease
MRKLGSLVVSCVVAGLLSIAGCMSREAYVPIDKHKLKGSGEIYFVPLANFPSSAVKELVAYYRSKYGLVIRTLPNLPLDSSVVDAERRQLIAEAVVDLIKKTNPSLVNQPEAILIGLTNEDMYIARYNWQYTFSWRQEGRYAVVSDARMNLGSTFLSEDKVESRLRKMVTKNIGLLYYQLPQSGDPRSVLYNNIDGIAELDYMGEEF